MWGKWLELMGFVALALFLGACSEIGVGDACVPKRVPLGGFLASETYLETSSPQCATGVCLVRELAGDPNNLQEEGCLLGEETCVSQGEVAESVYCSCRCKAPAGSDLPTCACPGGFTCEEVLETGGDGLRGSYCVREELAPAQE
jgi:hypothetical protein